MAHASPRAAAWLDPEDVKRIVTASRVNFRRSGFVQSAHHAVLSVMGRAFALAQSPRPRSHSRDQGPWGIIDRLEICSDACALGDRRCSIAFDAIALVIAYLLSTLLRYDGVAIESVWLHALALSGVAVLLYVAAASYLRVYRGRFGVATIDETLFLGLAASAVGLVVTVANALSDPLWLARIVPLSATFLGLVLMLLESRDVAIPERPVLRRRSRGSPADGRRRCRRDRQPTRPIHEGAAGDRTRGLGAPARPRIGVRQRA